MTEQPYDIHKAAAIILIDGEMVVTRSEGKSVFVNPGGKLEADETEEQACVRELKEELGIDVQESDLEYMDTFYAEAAGSSGVRLKMGVWFVNDFVGDIAPHNEIAEVQRIGSSASDTMELGSICVHHILPRLRQENLIK